MTAVASRITSLAVVYSIVYSDADDRKHQSSASLAFVRGIHRDRWIPRTKGQWREECIHLMTSSCIKKLCRCHPSTAVVTPTNYNQVRSSDTLCKQSERSQDFNNELINFMEWWDPLINIEAGTKLATLWNAFSWIKISLYEFCFRFHWSFFPKVRIYTILPFVQIMAWRQPGNKTLYKPIVDS